MARTASTQFTLLSRDAAQKMLDTCSQSQDTIGDRIAAGRRVMAVTTAQERLDARRYNARRAKAIAKAGSLDAFRRAIGAVP